MTCNVDETERAATLRSSTGRLFTRPFQLLYPLECFRKDIGVLPRNELKAVDSKIIKPSATRPQRNAAKAARKKITLQIE